MERLTWYNGEHWTQAQRTDVGYRAICTRLAAYEDTGLEPEEIGEKMMELSMFKKHGFEPSDYAAMEAASEAEKRAKEDLQEAIHYIGTDLNHIRELLAAERDEKLAIQPCEVGDTMYCDGKYFAPHCSGKVMSFKVARVVTRVESDFRGELEIAFDFDDFGKKVFLTSEEAKNKMEGEQ